MLSILRKNAGSWIIKFLLFAIVLVFIFWGFGTFRERQRTTVATVNGQVISQNEFEDAYNRLKDQMRERFGDNFNDDLIKMMNLKSQALNQIIDQRLLLEEADRLSLKVTDDELAEAIKNFGPFQSAGIFNQRLYHTILNNMKLTPEKFESLQREAMLIGKLQSYLLSSVLVTDQEAWEFYRLQNASADIDYVLFDPKTYTGIMPTADEIEAYYKDHSNDYKTEPMVKVRYINFEAKAYASKTNITDEDIAEYYEMHLADFTIPKTVDARHILLKVDPGASPEEVEKVRQKALDILKMARDGKDFAELARKYSEGPTKSVGGKLGPFTREAMEKSFSDMAFSMKPGDISEPVRTRYGWHIIKVETVNEETTRSLEEAKPEIREKLETERGKELAYEAAQEVYEVSFEGDDLIKAAEAMNLSVLTSDFFTKKDPDRAIKDRMKFGEVAFDLSPMEIGPIVDHGDGYYILQVIDTKPEKIPDLQAVSDEVRQDLIKKKQDETAKKEAEEFLSQLKNGNSMDEESKKLKMVPVSTGFFKRGEAIPKIGYEPSLSEAAFTLSEENLTPEHVIKGQKGYYVIQFRERKEPEKESFRQQESETKDKLVQQKKIALFDSLLAKIKENSDIDIEERFIE